MREYKRYYMHLRIDISGNNPEKAIKKINEKIEDLLANEGEVLASKGYSVDMGWNWSEHTNL